MWGSNHSRGLLWGTCTIRFSRYFCNPGNIAQLRSVLRISAGRCSSRADWCLGYRKPTVISISPSKSCCQESPTWKKTWKARTVQSLDMELNRISPISGKWEARKAESFQGALILILGVCRLAWCFSFISALCHSDPCQNSYQSSVVRCPSKPTGKGEILCLSQNLSHTHTAQM